MDKYEEILTHLKKKEENADSVQNRKADLDNTFWENVKKCNIVKADNDFYKSCSIEALIRVSNKAVISNYMYKQQEHVEEQIKGLQEQSLQFELENEAYTDRFCKFMQELTEMFDNNKSTYNETNTSNEVNNFNNEAEMCRKQIKRLSKEMEENKQGLGESELLESDNFNLRNISTHIKNESLKQYGDPNKLHKRLNEIKNNVEFQEAKVKTMEKKWGVN